MEKCYEMGIFTQICNCLASYGSEGRKVGGWRHIWSDGDRILCSMSADADLIADVLEMIGYEDIHTGYYDPKEDAQDGINDEYTGYWYVELD